MKVARLARSRGFTLIEIAVALVVVALVLGSILVPLTTQVVQRKVTDTQKALDEIKEALAGFAIANGYLPCPAVSATNGLEDRDIPTGICTGGRRQGYIPWVTLGVSQLDAWGHVFRYSVSLAYASSVPLSTFTLTTARDITIRTRDGAGNIINLTNVPPNGVPAVVLSHGRNGYGSVNERDIAQALPGDWPANYPDENTNATGLGTIFFSRAPQDANAVLVFGGEFDDIIVWLSPNLLFNRMVAAGKLP